MITSARNPKLKLVRDLLGRPKDRRAAGAFVAEGVRLVEEAAAAGWPFRFALFSETVSERGRALLADLRARGVDVEPVEAKLLDSLSETETSPGLLAVLALRPLSAPPRPGLVLIPDSVRDPGNLGTLLRTARAAGVDLVLLPPGTTDPFAPKVVRAGMGAHFHLPLREADWNEIESIVAGMRVLLAEMDGVPCWETDLRGRLALIVGGEAEGAGEQARRLAQARVGIPMAGGSESLNVATAAAVLLFEAVRQRRGPTEPTKTGGA